MRVLFRGFYRNIYCCNFDEVIKDVKQGEWFRTDSMDWYYKVISYGDGTFDKIPAGVYLLQMQCATSVKTRWKTFAYFLKSDDTEQKIYVGKNLEDKICEELKLWVKEMNPRTMRAFSGKSFVSYLNAIPKDIYLREGFADRMKQVLTDNFVKRIKKLDADHMEELNELYTISKSSKEIIDKNLALLNKENSLAAEKSKETFEQLRERRIKEITKEK